MSPCPAEASIGLGFAPSQPSSLPKPNFAKRKKTRSMSFAYFETD